MNFILIKTTEQQDLQSIRRMRELEVTTRELLRLILADDKLIEGSYCEIHVKCGRPGCHCEKKPIHRVARLSTREDGKIRNKVVRVAGREEVKRLTDRFRQHKQALQESEKISEIEREILKVLIKRKIKGSN